MPTKKRPRTHVIADLSVNHVERHVLTCGFSADRVEHDYGYDLVMHSYNEYGEIESGFVFIQVKATDSLQFLADAETISFPLDRRDVALWLEELEPVILIVYDAQHDVAYWLYVQAYFERLAQLSSVLENSGNTVTVHFERSRVLDADAIRGFARFRDRVHRQGREVIRHEY